MSRLKYGIEIEGAGLRKYTDTREDFRRFKSKLEERNDTKILIKRRMDFTAKVPRKPSSHVHKLEFKSSKPIKDIDKHIKNWRLILDEIDYMYNPKNCGLHIHTSPLEGNWEGRYTTYMFNLFFILAPFTRFFKNRKEQDTCLGGGKYSKLLRFFSEDVNPKSSKSEFISKWSKSHGKSEFNFGGRNMLRICEEYNTIETRLFPPEPELLDTYINLITRIWKLDTVLNPNKMLDNSIFDVLKMFDLQDDLYKFKNYYKEWIK